MVFQSPAGSLVVGRSPTRSPSGTASVSVSPSRPSSPSGSRRPDFDRFRQFFRLGRGIPAPPLTTVVLEAPGDRSFPPGYELSKPTPRPDSLVSSGFRGIGGNPLITVIRPAPQTGQTRVGVIDDALSRVSLVSSANSGSAAVPAPNNWRHKASFSADGDWPGGRNGGCMNPVGSTWSNSRRTNSRTVRS